jgi:hypothetical protein
MITISLIINQSRTFVHQLHRNNPVRLPDFRNLRYFFVLRWRNHLPVLIRKPYIRVHLPHEQLGYHVLEGGTLVETYAFEDGIALASGGHDLEVYRLYVQGLGSCRSVQD